MNRAFDAAFEVYSESFPDWPVGRDLFGASLGEGNIGTKVMIESRYGAPAGACIYGENGVYLLVVSPDYRCLGIGSILLDRAEAGIVALGGVEVALGHAGGCYLWQGVPIFSGGEDEFFIRRGYRADWVSVDMAMALKDFCGVGNKGAVEISACRDEDKRELLECVRQVEAGWVSYYTAQDLSEVLVARADGKIAGFVMACESGIRMEAHFAGRVGGIACLGVLPEYRRRGIGADLARAATLRLKRRGFDYSYVGYTWLEEWYARLGYRRLISFWMGTKKLR